MSKPAKDFAHFARSEKAKELSRYIYSIWLRSAFTFFQRRTETSTHSVAASLFSPLAVIETHRSCSRKPARLIFFSIACFFNLTACSNVEVACLALVYHAHVLCIQETNRSGIFDTFKRILIKLSTAFVKIFD